MFLSSLDACAQDPDFPMTVVTGTGSKVAWLVYDRPRDVDFKTQKDKFHMYWLQYEYSELEICLMLSRQGKKGHRLQNDVLRWVPSYSTDDGPIDIELLTTDVDKALPEDVTLALALAVVRASGYEPASVSASDSAKAVDSHWIETGQVVHPSLDHVVKGIRADASGNLEVWQESKARPGRLTLQAAKEALKDERVLHAAYASRSKVVRRVWQTGMTARSLNGINIEDDETNEKLHEWHQRMHNNTNGFQEVMLALLDCMYEANPNWQRDVFANPLKPPKAVTVRRLLERHTAMHRNAAVENIEEFQKQLNDWRLEQLVAYRAASEQASFRSETSLPTVGFLSSMFAFLALRWSLMRNLFVTRREYWAIHKQTGQLGEDFELVVAESMHRNFVSKVLAKNFMPSIPRYLWEKEDGSLEEGLVKHDRTQVFEGGNISIQLTKTNWGQNPSREKMIGRVLKEVPDRQGGDLVVILEDTEERDPQKYHLIRIQVKAGGADKELERENFKGFLSRNNVKKALQMYAEALGVQPEQLEMHRLLLTPKKLAKKATSLFHAHDRSGNLVMGAAGVADSSTPELVVGELGDKKPDIHDDDDTSNLYCLDHDDYQEFLFADARVLSARIWANAAGDVKEKKRLMQKADNLERSLSGLLDPKSRRVESSAPSDQEAWTVQFPIKDTDSASLATDPGSRVA